MGQEITTTPIRIKQFLGLNNKITDTAIDLREASALQNVNLTEESCDQRNGSVKLHTVAFKDKTDSVVKNITGIYEGILNGTRYQVGIGGDAFKQLSAGAWVDKTGAVTITDDDDIHWSFATFLDSSFADIIIAANGINAPIKWTGSGNAAALSSPPGNFNFPVVHKNKLWVAVGDVVYFSALRNGESWDTSNDIARFINKGEDITGLYRYSDRIVVFQESAIHVISGSSTRDLYVQTVVTGDGCASGYSIQEIESRRYGNILAFLSPEGTFKGFNGTKNLIKLGDLAEPLFRRMNGQRKAQCVSLNYRKLGQYWLGMTYASGTQTDQIMIYDYLNDIYSNESGRPLSSILYHTGIKSNAMAIFTSAGSEYPVTANYSGFALKQDSGLLDEETDAIVSQWKTGRIDFNSPSHIKMLTDLNIVTTQSSATNMAINVTSGRLAGVASLSIEAAGGLWGENWGELIWSAPSTAYTRAEITPIPSTSEEAIMGRYHQFEFNHSDPEEAMSVEELIIGVTDLGDQPEFLEVA